MEKLTRRGVAETTYPYSLKVFNERLEINNKVGVALIKHYQERFPEDVGYVLGRAREIAQMDTAKCLMQWFYLDTGGRELFAQILGMPPDLLAKTCEGIKWLANN